MSEIFVGLASGDWKTSAKGRGWGGVSGLLDGQGLGYSETQSSVRIRAEPHEPIVMSVREVRPSCLVLRLRHQTIFAGKGQAHQQRK